jgi:ribosomal-protein-alanine N-acetyltransferase
LAEEALRPVVAHLFHRHTVPELTAEVDPRNRASMAVLRKLGFRETHRAERTMQWREEWCDSVYYALARPPA